MMTAARRLLLSALLVLISGCSAPSTENQKSFSAYGISPEAVERVEILYLPERVLTRTALTPEMLERVYEYKVEIPHLTDTVPGNQLISLLRKATFERSNDKYDLRTAVLLYDNAGKRIASLYFDRSGKQGALNDQFGVVTGGVYKWAKGMMKGFAD
jgi:hypothetical protein